MCSVLAHIIRAVPLCAERRYVCLESIASYKKEREEQRSEKCPISLWRHCSPQILSPMEYLYSLISVVLSNAISRFLRWGRKKTIVPPRGIERQRERDGGCASVDNRILISSARYA